jgi:hypothetical protein
MIEHNYYFIQLKFNKKCQSRLKPSQLCPLPFKQLWFNWVTICPLLGCAEQYHCATGQFG